MFERNKELAALSFCMRVCVKVYCRDAPRRASGSDQVLIPWKVPSSTSNSAPFPSKPGEKS